MRLWGFESLALRDVVMVPALLRRINGDERRWLSVER